MVSKMIRSTSLRLRPLSLSWRWAGGATPDATLLVLQPGDVSHTTVGTAPQLTATDDDLTGRAR